MVQRSNVLLITVQHYRVCAERIPFDIWGLMEVVTCSVILHCSTLRHIWLANHGRRLLYSKHSRSNMNCVDYIAVHVDRLLQVYCSWTCIYTRCKWIRYGEELYSMCNRAIRSIVDMQHNLNQWKYYIYSHMYQQKYTNLLRNVCDSHSGIDIGMQMITCLICAEWF